MPDSGSAKVVTSVRIRVRHYLEIKRRGLNLSAVVDSALEGLLRDEIGQSAQERRSELERTLAIEESVRQAEHGARAAAEAKLAKMKISARIRREEGWTRERVERWARAVYGESPELHVLSFDSVLEAMHEGS